MTEVPSLAEICSISVTEYHVEFNEIWIER